jgi:hypothetical protein
VLAIQKDGYALIPLADVCSFQVEDGVTQVRTATATFRTNYAINDLEKRLPVPPFFRAHRATIANLDKVATISPLFKGALLAQDEGRTGQRDPGERDGRQSSVARIASAVMGDWDGLSAFRLSGSEKKRNTRYPTRMLVSSTRCTSR